MNGLVHIYYGDGKGKTTAAIGLGVRAAGAGLKVYMAQFLKTNQSAELSALKSLKNFVSADAPALLPFFYNMSEKEKREYTKYALNLFRSSAAKAAESGYNMLILDEILDAVQLNIIDENEILAFLSFKPAGLEVILTGHTASEKICGAADYVSLITAKKHPYAKGTAARKGIEF